MADLTETKVVSDSELLVFGYFNRLQQEHTLALLVPSDVVHLIVMFLNTFIFPLTTQQSEQISQKSFFDIIVEDITLIGNISADHELLKLKIDLNVPPTAPLILLEMRLGVLLTVYELAAIRDHIAEDKKALNAEDAQRLHKLIQLNDAQFWNHMVSACHNGVWMNRHKRRGVCVKRRYLIHGDRLFWTKTNKLDRAYSIQLNKIVNLEIGTKLFRSSLPMEMKIPSNCCLSIVSKNMGIDLSSANKDALQTRLFAAYIRGLQEHFFATSAVR
eukprot:CAMPEP_0197046168 /NCGR_PEP_ID=MMETSP1384-20130603/21914_1 /TAXON_ID=29189 /ORGANISM="Ammonia sp." /LENGTH=272 /DNA_ID=CAMNT_0042477901 /DNA_START=42 /DNA_END=860 /DNA_ORIENTATION=-